MSRAKVDFEVSGAKRGVLDSTILFKYALIECAQWLIETLCGSGLTPGFCGIFNNNIYNWHCPPLPFSLTLSNGRLIFIANKSNLFKCSKLSGKKKVYGRGHLWAYRFLNKIYPIYHPHISIYQMNSYKQSYRKNRSDNEFPELSVGIFVSLHVKDGLITANIISVMYGIIYNPCLPLLRLAMNLCHLQHSMEFIIYTII